MTPSETENLLVALVEEQQSLAGQVLHQRGVADFARNATLAVIQSRTSLVHDRIG
jgi:hypothetical protein